jgi:hypothetical protein
MDPDDAGTLRPLSTNRRDALGCQMQHAAQSPGTQPLPRVRGDAPATGLSMREIGMNSRPLGACSRCGGGGRGGHLSGAIGAGFVSSGERMSSGGSGPSSGGWVAFRVRRGSPCLERMYYNRASPSSLFRTNFLILASGVAGADEAGRSHSTGDTATTVPTHAGNPTASRRTLFGDPREMFYLEIRVEAAVGLATVPERH